MQLVRLLSKLFELEQTNDKQEPIKVYYEGKEVGVYFADLIVNNTIIIELKATEYLIEENESQLINYLKATEMEVGLLLNFGKKPEVKRKVYSNNIEHIIKSLNN